MIGAAPLVAGILAALAAALVAAWAGPRLVAALLGGGGPARARAWARRALQGLAAPLARRLPARVVRAWAERLQRAGLAGRLAPEEVLALQALGAAAAALLAWAGLGRAGPFGLLPIVAAAAGGLAPRAWVARRARRRREALTRALPGHLDLLTLAVEAGLDLAAALAQLAEHARPGPLKEELAAVLERIRMGRTREEALRELAQRTGHPALGRLVTALVRAGRLGTPVGRVLRLEAARLRAERTRRAEQRAAEAPVKLLLPLVLFIFPTVFLVIFGPIAFQFLHGGGGG